MIGSNNMKELSVLKRELKCWESMFERTHGRKPNKDDINSGPEEIKESYCKYRELKESVARVEKEKCIQEDNDRVFGKNLNKKKPEEKASSLPFCKKDWAGITPVKLCHGQRPRKACPEVEKESSVENVVNENMPYGNEAKDQMMTMRDNFQEVKVIDTSEYALTTSAKKIIGSSIMFPSHQARNNNVKKRAAISSAWLEKYKPDLPEMSHIDDTCTGGLEENKTEFENVLTVEPCFTKNGSDNGTSASIQSESCHQSNEGPGLNLESANLENNQMKSNEAKSISNNLRSMERETLRKKIVSESKQDERMSPSNDDVFMKVATACQISRHRSTVTDMSVIAKTPAESIHPDLGDSAQETLPTKRKAGEQTLDEGQPNKKVKIESEDEEDQVFLESKGVNSADEAASEEDTVLPTAEKAPSRQHNVKKVSSGLVSDNFQRLNMKHRSYRRRGGGISGGAHKRRAWKQIMKSRGEFVPQKSWSSKGKRGGGGGGKSGSCFKCGEEGHWAKNCRGPKKQRSMAGKNFDSSEKETDDFENMAEFEPLPTIEEAAMMAAGIRPDDDSQGSEGLVILPHQLPRPVWIPPSPPAAIEPFYQPVDGKPVELTKEVLSALEKMGFSSFRPGQQKAVMRILCGMSSLVVLSTGAGKSLCYQLPAFLYAKRSPCLTLVISPLVSLMEDQISGLPQGLKGACLHTNLTKAQRQKVVDDLCSGKVSVLLLSPEALVGGGSGNGCLPAVAQLPQIAFACIDEAHCVSEWSHNFRPSYLRVCKILRETFGVRCFLGLTATATRSTAASVAEHIGIVHDPGAVIRGGAVPPNLFLSVSCDNDKTQALLQLLQGRRFSQCDSIIIYCTRREQTEKLASTLRTCLQSTRLHCGWDERSEEQEEIEKSKKKKGKGKTKSSKALALKWDAECYHAGMSAAQRRRVQKRFMNGQLRVVVATVAFGMGLDKSDVRAIIHYNLPRSFESYVQEIGRAGRDGCPSHCHVFLDSQGKDMCELRRHVYANTVDRSTIKKLVRRAFPRCECKKFHEEQQQRIVDRKNNDDLLNLGCLCDDPLDDSVEAALQAAELQHLKKIKVKSQMCDDPKQNKEEEEEERSGITSTTNCGEALQNTKKKEEKEELLESKSRDEVESKEAATNSQQQLVQAPVGRLCGGHEVAMVTECLIQELDMREENIATLLCYLELHPQRWLEVLQPVKSTCTVKFYGGHAQLRAVAQKIPPIAAAVSLTRTTPASFRNSNTITFSVVELADKMGWDLTPVCRELRALQWNTSLSRDHSLADMGQSGILVEFSDLSMHIRAPGDLSDEERDNVCNFLEDRILAEERSQLQQLQFVYDSLKSVSFSEYWQCADDVDKESDQQLKDIVKSYFEDCSDKTKKELAVLTKARKGSKKIPSSVTPSDHVNWDVISRDLKALLGVHHEHSFTGRAVARIFHGIDSPCYPAEIWGRDRRFWRKHLDVEFNSLRKFATQELIRLR
ncbi:ATP-dependent DNA helicase Q4-like isoform X2 [Montipora capricornis]|uniref:ATP-dependent DNA helicase Q4-like isoform X2 n=1 Tax=Montipora capricornis TaxID=246305 RepID=UPI0035F21B86